MHTHTHFNTVNRPGLRAGSIENYSLIQYKLGLYVCETFFWGFCHFLTQSSQNHVHNQQNDNFLGNKFFLITAMFVFIKRYMKRTTSKIISFVV